VDDFQIMMSESNRKWVIAAVLVASLAGVGALYFATQAKRTSKKSSSGRKSKKGSDPNLASTDSSTELNESKEKEASKGISSLNLEDVSTVCTAIKS
jgi:hypothetical protein